jgi:hypothetical protein
MTPEEVHQYCWDHSDYFDYPESEAGKWDEIVAFGLLYRCPQATLDSVAERLSSKVSAWDCYTHSEYGRIMFYVSRIPFDGEDSSGKNDPKTLVITGISATVYGYAAGYGSGIGVFPTGTTPAHAYAQTGIVAVAELDKDDIGVVYDAASGYKITIPLYNISNNNRWVGNGTFDVYVALSGTLFYRASSVKISSGTTTIPFSRATQVTP